MSKYLLVVRQHAWFAASLEVEGLALFPEKEVGFVPLGEPGSFQYRVLVGRGPLERAIGVRPELWFGQGDEPYPLFGVPSIGPRGAGVAGSVRPEAVSVGPDEAVALVQVSGAGGITDAVAGELTQPVAQGMSEGAFAESDADRVVRPLMDAARTALERTVGFYALYQYPVVWRPIGVEPSAVILDLEKSTMVPVTKLWPDNFVPMRLRVGEMAPGGILSDGAEKYIRAMNTDYLRVPFMLIQRALWQRNVHVRFLETFWIIEFLAGRWSDGSEAVASREAMYEEIAAAVQSACPQHLSRLGRLRGTLLQQSMRERISGYLVSRGMREFENVVARMVKLRNDLAHGAAVADEEVRAVELEVRGLARLALRREVDAVNGESDDSAAG